MCACRSTWRRSSGPSRCGCRPPFSASSTRPASSRASGTPGAPTSTTACSPSTPAKVLLLRSMCRCQKCSVRFVRRSWWPAAFWPVHVANVCPRLAPRTGHKLLGGELLRLTIAPLMPHAKALPCACTRRRGAVFGGGAVPQGQPHAAAGGRRRGSPQAAAARDPPVGAGGRRRQQQLLCAPAVRRRQQKGGLILPADVCLILHLCRHKTHA